MYSKIEVNHELVLKQLRFQYAHDIVEAMQDQDIYNNTLTVPTPYGLTDALNYTSMIKAFEAKHKVQKEWALIYDGKMMGAIGLHYDHGIDGHVSEIGYWLHKDLRGKGRMALIVSAFANAVFKQTNLIKLTAGVFDFNIASQKVLKNAGFQFEGTQKSAYLKAGELLNTHVYSILKA